MEFVHDAIDVVGKATSHDAHGRVAEAVYLYSLAVQLLRRALSGAAAGGAVDAATASVAAQKAAEYEARLEALLQQSQQSQKQSQQRSAMDDPRVRAGLSDAERAVQADSAGNFAEAVTAYRAAARQFTDAAADADADARKALSEQASAYTVRAEALAVRAAHGGERSAAAAAVGGAVPFGLAPGQTHYDDPMHRPSLLERIGSKLRSPRDHRPADAWLRR